ncbi:MAG: response regulator [Proteobacteria bacterium]|nr:response regulator [Pseudomonadota bacterium]
MKILIVDDEIVSRLKAQKILSGYGECSVAVNGKEAIEAFSLSHKDGEPYDLITMDIEMPDMDGIEALKIIREMEESQNILLGDGAKVVMLTGTSASQSILSSFNKGCEAYIVKPFDKEKINEKLVELGFAATT